MAITTHIYGPSVQGLLTGEFGDLRVAGVLKASLHTSVYVPNADHRYRSELAGEVSHASYTAGGKALTGVAVTYDALTNTVKLDCNDVIFPLLSATIRYVVFYREVLSAGTPAPTLSPLALYWNLGADDVSTSADYTVVISADGLLRHAVV